MAPTFLGGKLNLKGGKKKKKKSKHSLNKTGKDEERNTKVDTTAEDVIHADEDGIADYDDDLTETERKSLRVKKERETQELEKIANQSHRERIEEFNEKLGNLTELNDIPRVSAAGNG
eukprot:CAMPEP_0197232996 /NCGR_PEP_ID=MMETSP1429-20130617/1170_1 /TAXON_ID=49237 /ORGANISM="Chaetoceros  sp., Strain UNC1202" /LENGTH=117 /DNA_ID=CAMNT_0042691167 /DNA_START=199 /DNA_END=552 /DNA_ORIENTATION=+